MIDSFSEPPRPGNPEAARPPEQGVWKKLGATCDSKLDEFSSEVAQVPLRTETGDSYDVRRLILRDPQPIRGEALSSFVIEKILPTQGLPERDFVNSVHITKITPLDRGRFHTLEGYRYDSDGVVRRIVGDTIVPETAQQLERNIEYTKFILSSTVSAEQTNKLTERIARSTPSNELPQGFKFTGRPSDEEADRLAQEEDEEWFETQREGFRQRENPDPIVVPDEPWRQEVLAKAMEIAKQDGRGHPEEADFNTATIVLGDKIPKDVQESLKEDLKAIEEGRSSGNQ